MIARVIPFVVIGSGAWLFGWFDLYHLVIGVPALVVAFLVARGLGRPMSDGLQPDEVAEDSVAQTALRAGLLGMGGLLALAAAHFLFSRTPIHAWCYGRDCPALLATIDAYAAAGAHPMVVEAAGTRLAAPCSPACRHELLTRRIRARRALAAGLEGVAFREALESAREDARTLGAAHLAEAISLEIAAAELRQKVARQKQQIEARDRELDARSQQLAALQDAAEAAAGSIPAIPIDEAREGFRVTLGDHHFEIDRAELTGAAQARLDEVAAVLVGLARGRQVRVTGHTDSSGTEEWNGRLSLARARHVAARLTAAGVDPATLEVAGVGAQMPRSSNYTAEGRAENRRVEILIARDEPAPPQARLTERR